MADNLPDARPAEGVVFRHSVEALLNQVIKRRNLMTPGELREFNLEKPRDVGRDDWERLLRLLARKLTPDGTEAAGLEVLGREILIGYFDGLVGRGVFMVLKLLGPRRALLRMAENFETADNMTKVYPKELSPTHIELLFNDIGKMPTYVRGILIYALGELGQPNAKVTFEERADGYTRFDVSW
ncbi:MAG: DUF2378 family protein [Myxococcaceae bacterium]